MTTTLDPEVSCRPVLDTDSDSTGRPGSHPGPFDSHESAFMTFNIIASPVSIPGPGPIKLVNNMCGGGSCFELWSLPRTSGIEVEILSSRGTSEIAIASRGGPSPSAPGSLAVVGLGIRPAEQLTVEVRSIIASAHRVVHLADDESSLSGGDFERLIRAISPEVALIEPFNDGAARGNTQTAIDSRIDKFIDFVRDGEKVCMVTYGHPAVLYPLTHQMVRRARDAGLDAIMLPAVSSLDCLFADLLLDPVAHGLQVFDALSFLTLKRDVDGSVSLALMQPSSMTRADRLLLVNNLKAAFPDGHSCYLYRASITPVVSDFDIDPIDISGLADKTIKPGYILFIPAKTEPEIDKDLLKRFKRRRTER